MKFLIDQMKLKFLLEKKRDYIGRPKYQGWDAMITCVLYIVSLICSDFKSIWLLDKLVIQTLAWIIAAGLFIYAIYQIYIGKKYQYNHNCLYKEIENLNEVIHAFSIVAIKDTYNKYANRFLLHYDEVWECWFFFSFKTSENENEKSIKQRLSNKLKIDSDRISIQYISDRLQPKFSERDQIQKVYQHSLYVGNIFSFSEDLMQKEFELDGVRFKWWTIEEMEADSNIMKKNKDVVDFVKEKIA